MTNPRLTIPALLALILSSLSCSLAGEYERFTVQTPAEHNRELEIVYRTPRSAEAPAPYTRILILFGGRNWPGEKSLQTYRFQTLADRHNIVLLSPSFHDDDYWQPEKWSGAALFSALDELKKRLGIKEVSLYYYGYSAGGQCANLFYFWRPQSVRAVGIHACGVWAKERGKPSSTDHMPAPFLITCGREDEGRFVTSYTAVQQLRESGRRVIFRDYRGGHELNATALELAHAFFESIWSGKESPVFASEDYVRTLFPANATQATRLDTEQKNLFLSAEEAQIWLTPF